jgi:hypothetical protein
MGNIEAQCFLLAATPRETQYKRVIKKKKHVCRVIFLWTLLAAKGGKAQTSVLKMPICKELLAYDWSSCALMVKAS